MSLIDVWDHKGELEKSLTTLFDGIVSAFSSQVPPQFQKNRPRVEFEVQIGGGKRQWAPTELSGLETEVEHCFGVTIRALIVTEADMVTHTAFRCTVQHAMARLPALVNGVTLINHYLSPRMFFGGAVDYIAPEKGAYRTDITYSGDISVHADAWSKINQP